jgi:hypothetical protein
VTGAKIPNMTEATGTVPTMTGTATASVPTMTDTATINLHTTNIPATVPTMTGTATASVPTMTDTATINLHTTNMKLPPVRPVASVPQGEVIQGVQKKPTKATTTKKVTTTKKYKTSKSIFRRSTKNDHFRKFATNYTAIFRFFFENTKQHITGLIVFLVTSIYNEKSVLLSS